MPLSVSKYLPRHNGLIEKIDFNERPICNHCTNPMKIVNTLIVGPIVGLSENYNVHVISYRCGNLMCKGSEDPSKKPENKLYPPKSDFDYEVHAKVAELRWRRKLTYEEIIIAMEKEYGILLNLATIERMLKIYEIGCSQKYRPEYVQKIQKNGGILLTIDGMKPLKGEPPLYTTRDDYTELKIHSKRLTSESTLKIKEFLLETKQRIDAELGVPIVGIISDAHPKQRKAIAEVFPGIPHCLCHYHFYTYVFKAPKELDSQLMTQTRKFLRALYYLNKEKNYDNQGKHWEPKFSFTKEIITILRTLSNWTLRPKDPYFIGVELFSRLIDICEILHYIITKLDIAEKHFEDEKVVRELYLEINGFIELNQKKKSELDRIRVYLSDVKSILDDKDTSAENALELLKGFCKKLEMLSLTQDCGSVETQFIADLSKFVETKGELLFNFKRIKGAPKTNNAHELSFKQLKHFLRKVVGFRTAKSYLLSHGERIVFVNPKESFEGILEILKSVDYKKARNLIRSERVLRDNIRFIIHDVKRWNSKLHSLMEKANELLEWLFMKN